MVRFLRRRLQESYAPKVGRPDCEKDQFYNGGYEIGKSNVEERRTFECCNEKELLVANISFEKMEQRKTTYSVGGNETDIDFVVFGKSSGKYLKDVKAIPWKLQHWLMVTDMDKRKL